MLGELQPWFAGWPSLDHFRKEMDDLLTRFFGEGYRSPMGSTLRWPITESYFKDGNWVVRFDLPGVDPKDIDVSVAGDILTVRASRERTDEHNHDSDSGARNGSYARFEHSVTLPKGVKSDGIKANYQHGVLELCMPAAPEVTGRKIPVAIGNEDRSQIENKAA
jgi:HSP20 family protein